MIGEIADILDFNHNAMSNLTFNFLGQACLETQIKNLHINLIFDIGQNGGHRNFAFYISTLQNKFNRAHRQN